MSARAVKCAYHPPIVEVRTLWLEELGGHSPCVLHGEGKVCAWGMDLGSLTSELLFVHLRLCPVQIQTRGLRLQRLSRHLSRSWNLQGYGTQQGSI